MTTTIANAEWTAEGDELPEESLRALARLLIALDEEAAGETAG